MSATIRLIQAWALGGLAAVGLDGSYEAIRLFVRRRVDIEPECARRISARAWVA